MDEINDIDFLDRQLRDSAPYIDDDGFTRRVLEQLPIRRNRQPLLRSAILFGATVLASFLAYVLSDGGRFISNGIARMAGLSPVMLMVVALLTGLLVMSAGIVAAVSGSHEARS